MKKLKRIWFSVNGRIRICIAVSLFSIITISFFSFLSSWINARKEAYGFSSFVENEIVERIDKYLGGYEKSAGRAGYYRPVQQYLLSESPTTVILNSGAASGYIGDVFNTTNACRNIYLYSENGRYLYANRNHVEEIRKLISFQNSPKNIIKPFFVVTGSSIDSEESLVFYFYPVYNILQPGAPEKAVCVLVCAMQDITDISLLHFGNSEGTAIMLFDGYVVSKSGPLSSDELDIARNAPEGRGNTGRNRIRYITEKITLAEQPWSFVYIIRESIVMSNVFTLMNNGFLYLCGFVLIIVVILAFIMESVDHGIHNLVKGIEKVEYGHKLCFTVEGPHLEEFEKIFHSVNAMLTRMDAVFREERHTKQKLFEAATAQMQAEFSSYRSQINPHFLFNSLESMRSLAHNFKDQRLETMISSMSKMFRYSLYSKSMEPPFK
jgi:two-component system sensor histidine kinase YesM